jgi:hypothetical protein
MLRDIQLPVEYAKGLEGVLLKEQENEQERLPESPDLDADKTPRRNRNSVKTRRFPRAANARQPAL